jgi:hypothetical protein
VSARRRSSGRRCRRVATCSLIVGCFFGQPKRAQARGFLHLGLLCGSLGGINFLFCLELLLGTPSVCRARQELGTHWLISSLQVDDLPGQHLLPGISLEPVSSRVLGENPLAVEQRTCRPNF